MSLTARIDVMFASAILGAALFFSTGQIQRVILRSRTDDQTIRVPGAAKRRVESDLAVYRAALTYQAADAGSGYKGLAAAVARLDRTLRTRRGPREELRGGETQQLSAVSVREVCQSENCRKTGTLDRYELTQSIEIRSPDLSGLTQLAADSASLVSQADLASPELKLEVRDIDYVFTRLEELKLEALAEATRNARERAAQLAAAAGVRLGPVLSAHLGDVEIRVPDQPSQRYADDATSRQKDIVSNVTVTFAIR
ncbi:MAG: SIMPL domain-containing protein [Polyangia bacterium]